MHDSIVDLKKILTDELDINDIHIEFQLTNIICDVPAKSFIKVTQMFNTKHGYDICTSISINVSRTATYQSISFNNKLIFEQIINYCRSSVDVAYTIMHQNNVPINPTCLARTINNVRAGLIPKHPTSLHFNLQYDSIQPNYWLQILRLRNILL